MTEEEHRYSSLHPKPASTPSPIPTIHVISDSLGATGQALARAAAAQFGVMNPRIQIIPHVRSWDYLHKFLIDHTAHHMRELGTDQILIFYTLVDEEIRAHMEDYAAEHPNIIAVDLITAAIEGIAQASHRSPLYHAGAIRNADENYFKRIEAIEFTIEHDDGRNPQELTLADIVLIGVSRTGKTPLSIYLAQQGYKVANIPLDPTSAPPKELADVDPKRLFGLMTTPDVLVDIRKKRLGKSQMAAAGRYADLEYVYEDLEKARALMRKLGCIVIRTEKRAVEETAQEILRYYERAHSTSMDII